MTRFNVMKATAPSAWASYLINGDASGIEDADVTACDAWIAREAMGLPVDCEDAGFIRYHDAFNEMPLSADCQEYAFLVPKPMTRRERKAARKLVQQPFHINSVMRGDMHGHLNQIGFCVRAAIAEKAYGRTMYSYADWKLLAREAYYRALYMRTV